MKTSIDKLAVAVAAELATADFSVSAALVQCRDKAAVLEFLTKTAAAIPAAIEKAAASGNSDMQTLCKPSIESVLSRLHQSTRTAISRWSTGKSAVVPVWFDSSLSISYNVNGAGYLWVPKPVRNNNQAAEKKAAAEAEKAAEIEKAAESKAAALLADSKQVKAAASKQVKAAESKAADAIKAAESKAAALSSDKQAAESKAAALQTKVNNQAAEIIRLKDEIGRLKSQIAILQRVNKDSKVLDKAAAMVADAITG